LVGNRETWFYVRYWDRYNHLRVRIPKAKFDEYKITAFELQRRCLSKLSGASDSQWRKESPFVRELVRYGGAEGCVISEILFTAGSGVFFEYIKNLHGSGRKVPERKAYSG